MDPQELLKAIPPSVIQETYSDTVKGTLREASTIGVDALKTIHLILFPIQFAAAFQDRLASYLDKAIRRVPRNNRIAPTESLALPIAEKLKFQEEGSSITEMYISLLARAMDRERVGEAHPAFIHIVGQLSPDEAILLLYLARFKFCVYGRDEKGGFVTDPRFVSHYLDANRTRFATLAVSGKGNQVELTEHELLHTYVEHLVSLGLVVYTNDPWRDVRGEKTQEIIEPADENTKGAWFIQLNRFGRLFHSACMPGIVV